jgi:RNA polymerase sigma-B factor
VTTLIRDISHVTSAADAVDVRNEDEFAREYLPLARGLAGRFAGRGAEYDDLIQVANLALVKAIRRYDPSRGAFAPFASATISGELKRYLRDLCWVVKPPRRIQELQSRITRAVDDAAQQDGAQPRPEAIAQAVDASVDETVEALRARGCFTPASLDRPSPTTGACLGDSLADGGDSYEEIESRVLLVQICSDLGEEDRRLIQLRFYEEKSQREIAAELGISQMQVCRRLRALIEDLRERAGEQDLAS